MPPTKGAGPVENHSGKVAILTGQLNDRKPRTTD
jgi:hypothetical protein